MFVTMLRNPVTSLTRLLLPKQFTMMLLPTPLMILLRRESLKSDNTEEAHDASDKGMAAQAFHNVPIEEKFVHKACINLSLLA